VRREIMKDGVLEKHDGRYRLRFRRALVHPPEKVWRALTESEHLAAWFPTEIRGERRAGAKLTFVFPEGEGEPFDGEMLVYDPPRVLELRWGEDTLRFELEPDGGGCVLMFYDTLDDLGKAARDGAGWHSLLDVLEAHLAGDTPSWGPEERWKEVHPRYVERFGPQASTQGPPEPKGG
jgi:uncharacterized protein YndB with AHSA1/START domain